MADILSVYYFPTAPIALLLFIGIIFGFIFGVFVNEINNEILNENVLKCEFKNVNVKCDFDNFDALSPIPAPTEPSYPTPASPTTSESNNTGIVILGNNGFDYVFDIILCEMVLLLMKIIKRFLIKDMVQQHHVQLIHLHQYLVYVQQQLFQVVQVF